MKKLDTEFPQYNLEQK